MSFRENQGLGGMLKAMGDRIQALEQGVGLTKGTLSAGKLRSGNVIIEQEPAWPAPATALRLTDAVSKATCDLAIPCGGACDAIQTHHFKNYADMSTYAGTTIPGKVLYQEGNRITLNPSGTISLANGLWSVKVQASAALAYTTPAGATTLRHEISLIMNVLGEAFGDYATISQNNYVQFLDGGIYWGPSAAELNTSFDVDGTVTLRPDWSGGLNNPGVVGPVQMYVDMRIWIHEIKCS